MTPKVIKLDASNKKIIIFSDTHLSHRFDPAQLEFIKETTESADRVIINGDFWDSYETTFDQFVNSEWRQLFPLLKKKKAIYLYGNHDLEKFSDKGVKLFSITQADVVELTTSGQKLRIEHGHRITPSLEDILPLLFNHVFMLRLGNFLQRWGVKLAREKFLFFIRWHRNLLARSRVKNFITHPKQVAVCGHSHLVEFSPDKKYINNGVIRWGLGQYLIVEDGQLDLVRGRYD
jgi:predicted phosphodiesterase